MNQLKRLTGLFLILCILAVSTVVPAFAADEVTPPVYSSESLSVSPGETFQFPVYISDVYDLGTLKVVLAFDENVFEITDYSTALEMGSEISGMRMFDPYGNPHGAELMMLSVAPWNTGAERVLLCNISLHVKDDAPLGTAEIYFVTNSEVQDNTQVQPDGQAATSVMPVVDNSFTITVVDGDTPEPTPSASPDPDEPDDPNTNPGNPGTPGTPDDPDEEFVPVQPADTNTLLDILMGIASTAAQASQYELYQVNDYAQEQWDLYTIAAYDPDKIETSDGSVQAAVERTDVQQAVDNATLLAPEVGSAIEDVGAVNMLSRSVGIRFPEAQTNRYEVVLDSDVYSLWAGEPSFDSLTLDTPVFDTELLVDTLQAISAAAPDGARLVFEKQAGGGIPAYQLTIENMSGAELTDIYQNGVVLMLPVSLEEIGAETPEEAYAVDASGQVISSSVYLTDGEMMYASMTGAGQVTFGTGAATFSDLETVGWAESYINGLAAREIISGVGDGRFEPDRNITREEFTRLIVGAFGILDETATCEFTDVSEDAWYYPYVATAAKYGLVNGIGNGEFGVGSPITRQDMATLAKRAADFCQRKLRAENEQITFADDAQIADYARDSITIMQMAGIINGMGENRFEPNGYSTRAQAALVIYQLFAAIR